MFQNLGVGVLDNAFLGFNACIFAYGQTGGLLCKFSTALSRATAPCSWHKTLAPQPRAAGMKPSRHSFVQRVPKSQQPIITSRPLLTKMQSTSAPLCRVRENIHYDGSANGPGADPKAVHKSLRAVSYRHVLRATHQPPPSCVSFSWQPPVSCVWRRSDKRTGIRVLTSICPLRGPNAFAAFAGWVKTRMNTCLTKLR